MKDYTGLAAVMAAFIQFVVALLDYLTGGD
jgi:hypothetical protein